GTSVGRWACGSGGAQTALVSPRRDFCPLSEDIRDLPVESRRCRRHTSQRVEEELEEAVDRSKQPIDVAGRGGVRRMSGREAGTVQRERERANAVRVELRGQRTHLVEREP